MRIVVPLSFLLHKSLLSSALNCIVVVAFTILILLLCCSFVYYTHFFALYHLVLLFLHFVYVCTCTPNKRLSCRYLFGRLLLYDMFFTRVRSHGVCIGCSVASGYLLNNKLNEILSSRIPFLIITAPPPSVEQNETLTVQSPVADAHCLFGHFQLSHGFV